MDFYYITYKTYLVIGSALEKGSQYNAKLIVIADSLEDAEKKINVSLQKMGNSGIKVIQTSSIRKCEGISIYNGFENFHMEPIEAT